MTIKSKVVLIIKSYNYKYFFENRIQNCSNNLWSSRNSKNPWIRIHHLIKIRKIKSDRPVDFIFVIRSVQFLSLFIKFMDKSDNFGRGWFRTLSLGLRW